MRRDRAGQILAPLFAWDGLAVMDLLLEQQQLEMRLHAVELLSALLAHKKASIPGAAVGTTPPRLLGERIPEYFPTRLFALELVLAAATAPKR